MRKHDCLDCAVDRLVLKLARMAFEYGRDGGGGRVAPKEWQAFLRKSKYARRALTKAIREVEP